MEHIMLKIIMIIIALDVFALGVLLIFILNARSNIKRKILETRFNIKVLDISDKSESSEEAARELRITPEEFITHCKVRHFPTPEQRLKIAEENKRAEKEAQRKIEEEEAAWKAEQVQIIEERRILKEKENHERRERLKKFGYR